MGHAADVSNGGSKMLAQKCGGGLGGEEPLAIGLYNEDTSRQVGVCDRHTNFESLVLLPPTSQVVNCGSFLVLAKGFVFAHLNGVCPGFYQACMSSSNTWWGNCCRLGEKWHLEEIEREY